jgi:hypothetical protein
VSDTVDASEELWVSLAEAGRSQTPPVSRAAVSKRVKKLVDAGRLKTRKGPMGSLLVNLVEYLRAVKDETDPAQDLRNGRVTTPLLEDPADNDSPAETPGDANYHRSRARREAINAENSRLDLEERLGNILFRDDVERRTTEVFRKLRDRLLGMPATLSERLASQPDAAAVRAMLTTELRKTLDGFAKSLENMAEDDDV